MGSFRMFQTPPPGDLFWRPEGLELFCDIVPFRGIWKNTAASVVAAAVYGKRLGPPEVITFLTGVALYLAADGRRATAEAGSDLANRKVRSEQILYTQAFIRGKMRVGRHSVYLRVSVC